MSHNHVVGDGEGFQYGNRNREEIRKAARL